MSIATKCQCGNSPSGICHGNREWGCTMSFGDDVPLYTIKQYSQLQQTLKEKDEKIEEIIKMNERLFQKKQEQLQQLLSEKEKEINEYSLNLKNAVEQGGKLVHEKSQLQKEIERLKGLIQKAWFGNGMDCTCETCTAAFNQFKTENNL